MKVEKAEKCAITPTRKENFPEWFQQVIKASNFAEGSPVRGCMVIKPWGYGVWERIQQQLDEQIKETGHENAYFPLFIPLSFFEKEAAHVEGFAKECAVVTHHRLEEKDGKLIPAGELEEPLVVRPTSETIIGHSFARWVNSYRDLPLLINQWANVVRWEMRPRVLLRTTEFLWQEGHTVHATAEEAQEETLKMLEVYRSFIEDKLAIPGIVGEKSPGERFPGAVATYTIETMMQDGKALQSCTSHNLGQNFAKASEILFDDVDGVRKHAYTTSWGATTRLMGGLIMVHGDDDGLRLPPRVAPKEVVILPVIAKPETKAAVMQYVDQIAAELKSSFYHDKKLSVAIDSRDIRGGEKSWEWIKKGIPLRIEVGPRDLEEGQVVLYRRDRPHKEKLMVKKEELAKTVLALLDEIQAGYYNQAKAFRDSRIRTDLKNFEEFKAFFSSEESNGFVRAKWCGDPATEAMLEELKVTIRCLPLEQSKAEGTCILTGRPATCEAIFAKSY